MTKRSYIGISYGQGPSARACEAVTADFHRWLDEEIEDRGTLPEEALDAVATLVGGMIGNAVRAARPTNPSASALRMFTIAMRIVAP